MTKDRGLFKYAWGIMPILLLLCIVWRKQQGENICSAICNRVGCGDEKGM